jgi:hypothetical protein
MVLWRWIDRRNAIFVMVVLTVVRACFDVLEVVGVYALFLGSGTLGNWDLGWTPYLGYAVFFKLTLL